MGAVARAAALSCDFRTFQVYPKDLRALPVHPEPAVSWHRGFRRGAHARHKTTPVHHAPRRRGGVAARGASGAARAHTAHWRAPTPSRRRYALSDVGEGVPAGAAPL